MGVPLSSLILPRRGPSLVALERLAPPPPDDLVAAEIEARTASGDIVVELHGRGGWIARSAIDRLRRAYTLESTAISRLVAELVLRPPDLRHLDAAINALATSPRGATGLRDSIAAGFASTCPRCGGPVRVEEFVWDVDGRVPLRRSFRCGHCRDQRSGEARPIPVDKEDVARARALDASVPRGHLLGRFPVPDEQHPLPDELLALYTPRALDAIAGIIERIESDLRAPGIQAALRLALIHLLLPASRLNGYPGRVGALRINGGHVRPPGSRQVRERDPWLLFEEGCRAVRAFIQRVEGNGARVQARYGGDLSTLLDASSNVVVHHGNAADPAVGPRLPGGPGSIEDTRVRLVLTQLPVHWSPDNLGFAYLATSLALGYEAAATLPLDALFGPAPRGEWAWDAASLRRSLSGVRPVLAQDGRVVVILDRTGPGGLVAGVLGGVGAGYRLSDAILADAGDEIAGTLEFVPRESPQADERAFPELPEAEADQPFQLKAVERAVTDIAVAILQTRGEPARDGRLLGEVLIGLDRLGYLGRLVGARALPEAGDGAGASEAGAAGLFGEVPPEALSPREWPSGIGLPASWREPGRHPRGGVRPFDAVPPARRASATGAPGGSGAAGADHAAGGRHPGDEPFAGVLEPDELTPARGVPVVPPAATAGGPVVPAGERVAAWGDALAGADPVRLTLDIVMGELRRPDHPRLVEVEPGRWWLRDPGDQAVARPPLSDRVEWAVFSLLSTSGGITERAFYDRIGQMFRWYDTPDEELVRGCLESYRSPTGEPDGLLRTPESLQRRFEEHGSLVGRIVELGHRLGLRCWISPREQRRLHRGRPLAELLSEAERHAYLPLVHPGPGDALEAVDCLWYLRGKATFMFEVEWTAMLDESVIRRGGRIPTTDTLVRFLVIPPERTELVRLKLARSPLLRARLEEDNWHILKSVHLERLLARDDGGLDDLAPLLGLDPEVERKGEQLALFGRAP